MAEDQTKNLIIISPPFQVIGYKKVGIDDGVITITNTTDGILKITPSLRNFFVYQGKFQPNSEADPAQNTFLVYDKGAFFINPGEAKKFQYHIDWSKYQESQYKYISFAFKASDGNDQVGLAAEINSILAIAGSQSADNMRMSVKPDITFPLVFVLPSSTTVTVENTGSSIITFSGEASVKRGALKTIGKTIDDKLLTKAGFSLPGESYSYDLDWSKAGALDLRQQIGYYSIRTNIEYGPGRTPISVNYEFFYFPWWLALAILVLLTAAILLFKKLRSRKLKSQ